MNNNRIGRWNFKKKLILKFSKSILCSHYTHLGFKKKLLHQSFRKAIMCFYSNIGIININLILSNLRFCSKFLLSIILSNNKIAFALFEIPDFFKNKFNFISNYHLFNVWPFGLITNINIALASKNFIPPSDNYFPYMPAAVFLMDNNPERAFLITKETSAYLIPCFVLSDSIFDIDVFSYWIPTNLKSGFSKLFFINFINNIILKGVLIRKKLFFYKMKRMFKTFLSKRWLSFKAFKLDNGRKLFFNNLSSSVKNWRRVKKKNLDWKLRIKKWYPPKR